ncbi:MULTISPECIES: Fic family protein [unclassified Parvimonas]|uniref:Fic family protein n=1 Tax=unclassified Parvimonas TaxID=1151464 RepID=UPI002B471243|nr:MULTISPECIES: Fic family protein [unclassified Parvimonas]MEB3024423.1 Fic family protein [Parvimonas sp. M13]MEB3088747.1 Fic family protein [Parvimonas sp. M20]
MKIDFQKIKELNDYINTFKNEKLISVYSQIDKDFELKFTHESTKIEGNTLSIFEVKTILEDGYSVAGKELREIYEIINNKNAFEFIKEMIKKGDELTEEKIKDIHEIVVQNIFQGGIYRNVNVKITGASFSPPEFTKVREEMKNFIFDYENNKKNLNPIELASFTHAEFVRIHPFGDGNGRTSRLLMNYCLMKNGFKPISINPEERNKYYEFLDFYGKNKNMRSLKDFTTFLIEKEYKILLEYEKEIEFLKDNEIEKEIEF